MFVKVIMVSANGDFAMRRAGRCAVEAKITMFDQFMMNSPGVHHFLIDTSCVLLTTDIVYRRSHYFLNTVRRHDKGPQSIVVRTLRVFDLLLVTLEKRLLCLIIRSWVRV